MKGYKYMQFSQGKVVHLTQLGFVERQGYDDYTHTVCGKRYNPTLWFTQGLSYFNEIPSYSRLCKYCELKDAQL